MISMHGTKSCYSALKGKYYLSNHAVIGTHSSRLLDSLRGACALVVVFAHCLQIFIVPVDASFFGLIRLLAQAAVMLFFVLSGFLITKSITRQFAANFDARRYAADRANRLLPPLIAGLVIGLALWGLAPYFFESGSRSYLPLSPLITRTEYETTWSQVLGSVMFVNGFFTETVSLNGPLWSLPFEAWYYVAAGLICYARGTSGWIYSAILMFTLGALNKLFLLYSIVWFAGAITCIAHNFSLDRSLIKRILIPTSAVTTISLAAIYLYLSSRSETINASDLKYVALFNVSIGILLAGGLFVLLDRNTSPPQWLAKCAQFSYTLYVTHFPILLFMYGCFQTHAANLQGAMLLAALGFCCTVATA